MPRRILIIGCGYIGLPLALHFQRQGNAVTGWVRSPVSAGALRDQLGEVIAGSVADKNLWRSLPGKFDLVIHGASSEGGGVLAYQEVFLEGVHRMNEHQPQARRLFVSSTSVYGQNLGEEVTENSLAEPSSATSQILRQAENEALAAAALVIRPSGIYGPGRGALLEKFRRGEARIEGDGSRWLNQIHRDDLVQALVHLSGVGHGHEIYNVTDNEPVSLLDFYAWCSHFLLRPMPPDGPIDLHRKRGLTNKRVSNTRLRSSGWQPVYPSFRDGLLADHSPK